MENNYQSCLQQSQDMEQKLQMEVENAQNAEAQSFFQKLASEQRTITNQLQSKVNTASAHSEAQANAQQNQANAQQNQANAQQQNQANAQQNQANAQRNNQANAQRNNDNTNA